MIEKKKAGLCTQPDFKTSCKATAMQSVRYWGKKKTKTQRSMEQNIRSRNRAISTYGQLIFDKDTKVIQKYRLVSSTRGAGNTVRPHPYLTPYKKLTQSAL